MNRSMSRMVVAWPDLIALTLAPGLAWSRALRAAYGPMLRPAGRRQPPYRRLVVVIPAEEVEGFELIPSSLGGGQEGGTAMYAAMDAEELSEVLAFHRTHAEFQQAWQALHTTSGDALRPQDAPLAAGAEWRARTRSLPAVGQSAATIRTFRQEDVVRFAHLSGDRNPLHLDPDAWVGTPFTGNLVHGALTASLFSQLMGMELPGPGAVYLSQTLKFQAPLYIEETVSAKVTVVKVRDDKRIVTLATHAEVIRDGLPIMVLEGEAVVKVLDMAQDAPPA
jgi:3-hydroxybutyryl-CoA dehydratase